MWNYLVLTFRSAKLAPTSEEPALKGLTLAPWRRITDRMAKKGMQLSHVSTYLGFKVSMLIRSDSGKPSQKIANSRTSSRKCMDWFSEFVAFSTKNRRSYKQIGNLHEPFSLFFHGKHPEFRKVPPLREPNPKSAFFVPTVPGGHKHRVTTSEKPRKMPRTHAEPRRDPAETPQNPRRDPAEPSERPPQSPLRGKLPRRAPRGGLCPSDGDPPEL